MSEYSSTPISRRYTIVDTKANRPAEGSFDGQQFYATDENTSYVWDEGEGSWISTSASPDSTTITKNNNRELQVPLGQTMQVISGSVENIREIKEVADFEDGADGFSTYGTGADHNSRSSEYNAYDGSWYWRMSSYNTSGEFGFENSVDLTGFDYLAMWVSFRFAQDSDKFLVRVGGNIEFSDQPGLIGSKLDSSQAYQQILVDVSSYSGSHNIRIGEDGDGDTDNLETQVDQIELINLEYKEVNI